MNILKKALNDWRQSKSKDVNGGFEKRKSEQSGIALIMTLGVLSMLIVLALAFAASARTSSKMANNLASSTNARLIAEGAMARVFGVTDLTGTLYDKSQGIGSFNYNGDDYSDGLYRDGLSNLTSTNTDGSGLYNYSTADKVEWINVTADGKIIGRFAFIAFVGSGNIDPNAAVLHSADAPGAKDELNSASYTQLRPGIHVYELSLENLDPDNTYLTSAMVQKLSSDAVTGVGKLPNGGRWSDFTTIYDSSNLNIGSVSQHDKDIRNKFEQSYFILDGGLDPEAFWVDDVSVDGDRDDSSELDIRFNLARTDWNDNHASDGVDYDPEGDGGETNGEGQQDGYDEGADGVPERNDHALAFMNDYILVNPKDWDATHADVDGRGIRWINSLKSSPDTGNPATSRAGSFWYPNRSKTTKTYDIITEAKGRELRAKQIAANLIDYCDSDNDPTSDYPSSRWPTLNHGNTTNYPTFTGNEMTPVLSEIWMGVDVKFESIAHADPTKIIWRYTYTGLMGVEVHNPWPVTINGTILPIVRGSKQITFRRIDRRNINKGGASYSFGSWPGGVMPNINGPFPPGSYKSCWRYFVNKYPWSAQYAGGAMNAKVYSDGRAPDSNPSNSYASVNFKPVMVHLYYDSAGGVINETNYSTKSVVDFWRGRIDIKNGYKQHKLGDVPALTPGVTWQKSLYMHYSADDPRLNLHLDDWNSDVAQNAENNGAGVITGPLPAYGTHVSETPNSKNLSSLGVDLSTTYGDKEQQVSNGTDGSVSTSYIRNAPMKSPWEIGAIHRGAAWESLNIDKYDTDTPGIMDDYVDGDAQILDQVKITDDRSLYGKFNLNTTSSDCLRTLTMGIRVGTGYEFPTGDTNADGDVDDAGDTGTEINKANANTIASSISSALTSTWNRRSQVATAGVLSDGSLTGITQDTDAAKEEIIGKFINLTKAASASSGTIGSSANLIIIAQAIRDVGGVTIYKDVDFDGDTDGADEIAAGLDLDGDGSIGNTDVNEVINTTYGTYDLHADEILAEVKMYAIISYDSTTGKWTASKKTFIE